MLRGRNDKIGCLVLTLLCVAAAQTVYAGEGTGIQQLPEVTMTAAAGSNTGSSAVSAPPALVAQAPRVKTSWLETAVRPGEQMIGQSCKQYLASLSVPYSTSKWDPSTFEVKQASKLHPDIADAYFRCVDGRVRSIDLGSKQYRGKDSLQHTRELTDKIIASLHLPENGWKLISSDVDGSQSGWRTGYSRTYQRDDVEIHFCACYSSREMKERWATISISPVIQDTPK